MPNLLGMNLSDALNILYEFVFLQQFLDVVR